MKRFLALLLVGIMLFGMAACDSFDRKIVIQVDDEAEKSQETEGAELENTEPEATKPEITQPATIEMPNLKGLPLSDAMALLQGFSNVKTENCYAQEEPGIVIGQSVQAGTGVLPETVILLQVSIGPEPYYEENNKFPYTVTVSWSDQPIYSGPGYEFSYEGTVELAGVYTIMEECYDGFGNLWGRLKSGAGWIDLTNVYYRDTHDEADRVALSAVELKENTPGDVFYEGDNSQYAVWVGFSATGRVNFTLYKMDYGIAENVIDKMLTGGTLRPGEVFVAKIAFPGDFDTYGMKITDTAGNTYYYTVYMSNMDGSLVCAPSSPFQ